jgi:hypothetical protein
MEQQSNRVRLNLKQNAKGQVSFDVTAESTDPASSEIYLDGAIDSVRRVAKEKGLKFVDED